MQLYHGMTDLNVTYVKTVYTVLSIRSIYYQSVLLSKYLQYDINK